MRAIKLTVAICALTWLAAHSRLGAAEKSLQIDPGHNLLRNTEQPTVEIGEEITLLAFKDANGKPWYLKDLIKKGPVVFVFSSTECPLAQRYVPRLNRLNRRFKQVSFYGIFSNEGTSRQDVRKYAKAMSLDFPLVKDQHGYLARKLGATMTPQVFVVDQHCALAYRGAIDDHRYASRVKKSYLRDALIAILSGKRPAVEQTHCHGCPLHLPTAKYVEKVTYTRHIARVLQDRCVKCHRPGQVGPFALDSYRKARSWAKEIRAYAHARIMPPWKAAPDFGSHRNPQWLTNEELALLDQWLKHGTPEGDKADLPPPPRLQKDWSLGKPDQIVEMPDAYTLEAEGEDDYRHFIIRTSLEHDAYVRAIEVKPGNRKVVHHVVAFVDVSGQARKLDQADPGPGYTRYGDPGFKPVSLLGGWVPGYQPTVSPEGTGAWLPKGADIVLQVHYYRTGRVEKDRTKVGLYFSRKPKPAKIHHLPTINKEFRIPAGAARYEVRAERKLEADVLALSVTPHMHLLGREMKMTARLPNGKVIPLVWIKNWDFNWQMAYALRKPLLLPKGTTLQLMAVYDNSSANPNNPNDPPKEVGWGEKTTDEMCICYLTIVVAKEYQAMQKAEANASDAQDPGA